MERRFAPLLAPLAFFAPQAQSKSGIQVSRFSFHHDVSPCSLCSDVLEDSLTLKGEVDTGMAQVHIVNFSPDGSKIVGGGPSSDHSSGTIKVWELRDQPVGERDFVASKDDQTAIDQAYNEGCTPVSINGVAVSSWEEFDAKLEEIEGEITIKVWDSGASPMPPNHLSLARTDASCASLSLLASLNEIGSTDTGSTVQSVDFSPDGTKIVSGLRSGTIKVWDAGACVSQNSLFPSAN
jgi:WD40 repeat protein